MIVKLWQHCLDVLRCQTILRNSPDFESVNERNVTEIERKDSGGCSKGPPPGRKNGKWKIENVK